MSKLSEWQLMRLIDCAKTTRLGMEDQGFPQVMKYLAAKGYVEKKVKGYQVTSDGTIYLETNKEDIYLLTHTYPRNRKVMTEEVSDYDD
jgi:hypothetical protein